MTAAAWTEPVALFALHAAWQVPLLVCAAWYAVRVGRARAAVAHAVWMGTLLLCVALPVCATTAVRAAARQARQDAAARITFDTAVFDPSLPPLHREPVWLQLLHRHVSVAHGLSPFALEVPRRWQQPVASAYLLVLLLFAVRLLFAWVQMRKIVRASWPCTEPTVHAALERLAQQHRLQAPAVRTTSALSGPALAGVLRPVLLLPQHGWHLSGSELDAVLLHELAHLRRRDPLLHAAYSLLLLLVAFHPAAWWAALRLAQTREMACDEDAAHGLQSQQAYAHALLSVAERVRGPYKRTFDFFSNGLLGVGLELWNGKGTMEERMKNLFEVQAQPTRGNRAVRVATSVSLGLAAACVAGMVQVRPALAAIGQQATAPAAAVQSSAEREPSQDKGSRLIGGDHAREQLRQASRDLADAERSAGTAEERRRVATAREMALAAENAIAAASSDRQETHPGTSFSSRFPDGNFDTPTMHLPDTAMLQQQMEREREAIAKMEARLNSPEWKAQMQRQQENAARITRELNSPEWKERMQRQQEAIAKAVADINSPEFRARIEAASKVDTARISRMLADARQQQEQAMQHLQAGLVQQQTAEAARLMAHNEVPRMPDGTAASDDPAKVASGVMAGQVLQRVAPVYPPEAKEKKIQGEVLLHAIIGESGKVEQLSVVHSPDELLSKSALDAVRQWVYKPYLLNGQAVAVDTTITVNYSFGQ